ncbi:MAG: FAD-dependent oxidoreductase [Acidobacteriota bacterium]|nr:FAD-dependent oxidoreductase [Acidobacteriota bacterium]
MIRRWVLVGGGHAHLHVLRAWARRPLEGVELVLVSPYPHHHYSGMVPGYLRGTYAESDLTVDLPALARAAGARFVPAWVERVDGAGRMIDTGGERLAFDVASLDVGSEAAGLSLPGVAAHALTVRPMSRAVALRAALDDRIARSPAPLTMAVVGGGAAGVEVALALERRASDGAAGCRVRLLEGGPVILPEFGDRVRRLARRALARRGIEVRTGARVEAVDAEGVMVGGVRLPAALVVWLAGAAAPPLLGRSTLPRDPGGFLQVDATLRAVDGTPVWGAGDCIGIAGAGNLPKAGVYAVREAPVLHGNVRRALGDPAGAPVTYRPQRSFLALLNTADGRAILRWRGVALHARAAWRLKDRIDRTFVRQYQEPDGGMTASTHRVR